MRRAQRILLISGTAVMLLLLLVAGAALVLLQSSWLREKVRERIVAEVERATGGRAEAGSFSFDARSLTAEIRGFVLHGTEAAGKPPLFQARSVRVGLKLVSFFGSRKADIEYVGVEQPRIYLIAYPGGSTNIPAPKVRRAGGKPAMQTVLDLAVRRIEITGGLFQLEGQGTTPFALTGRNLEARLGYDITGPRYAGNLSMRPLDVQWADRRPLPVDVSMAVDLRAGRAQVTSGHLTTGNTHVDFSGAVTDLAPFVAAFDYEARASLPDLRQILEIDSPPSGAAVVSGRMTFAGISHYELAGNLHATEVAWRQDPVRLRGFTAEGAVSWTPERLESSGLRLAGTAYIGTLSGPQPVTGRIERVTLRSRDLNAAGVRLALMGGSFAGSAELGGWRRYRVAGDVAGFRASHLLSLYTRQKLAWDGLVSGPVLLQGDLRQKTTLTAGTRATITPAESGPPVRGAVAAEYSARRGTVDLGRSWLQLPSTRVDFSGVLGRELEVRLESRNLDDLLPVLDVKALPVRLENGTATFTGTVTGKLDEPQVAGRAALARFGLQGMHLDAFEGDVAVSKNGVKLRNGLASRGTLRARLQADAELSDWKAPDSGLVYAEGAVRNAAVSDLLAVAGRTDIAATGTLDATARLTGTYGSPRVAVDLTAVKGSLAGERFDQVTAKATYAGEAVEVGAARIVSGRKQVDLKADYRHRPGDFSTGQLRFDASSNGISLGEVEAVRKQLPDLSGTAQFNAAGQVEIQPSKAGQPAFRVGALDGHATVTGVSMNGQKLGDVDVRAGTVNGVLTAYLTSDFAGSAVRGDGTWKLAGDQYGKARVTFSRLDFLRLRQLFQKAAAPAPAAGTATGDVTVDGPMLSPEQWKAVLRISELQVGPARVGSAPGKAADFTLRNSGPITATMANGLLKIERARFVGRATDLDLAGSVAVRQANPLDLRLKGRVDLATLQDLDRDITATGLLNTDATIRGRFDDPQVNGRLEVKNAALTLAGFPNGIYNANGVLVFTGTRATIQGLTGESGGGKVRVGGFIGYEEEVLIFRLFMRAEQVRVRYPEGVSTVANATLNWTGDMERSTLAGTVTIVRTGFNPQSDFSSILAKSAEPVRTISAGAGILSGMHFDVQIETAPDITFESSLAQDIQMEANLRLRGTGTNPSLLGRINITQGKLVFFGTRYTINQGSISFFNPSRIEPVLNVDLETRARGVDVTLTISGPLRQLNLTPRSDPPLQFNEIIALLATGRAPTTQTNTQVGQSAAGASWQQLGASALLGQAVASPVAGRLQRFFGVTQLKIDPSLAGVEYNPQARVTLEQQITPNITFTYITNVTSSNPLVVQVEWAINRRWSVIAVKDENGEFGLDFLFKKRF